jgi:ABC-type amino acid transport substrate-binding protein
MRIPDSGRVAGYLLCWMLISPIADPVAVRAETIRVGFFVMPPLAVENPEGSPAGAAVSMFLEIAEAMGIDAATLNAYPLKRLLHVLERDAIDAALTLGKTPGRAERFVYPERPFFRIQPALAVRRDHPLTEIRGPDALRGLRIAIYEEGFLSPSMGNPNLDRVTLTDSDVIGRGLAMVDAGHVDAFYNPDDIPIRYRIRRDGFSDRIRVLPLPDEPEGLFTVFSRKGAARFLERYETALRKIGGEARMEFHLDRAMAGAGANRIRPFSHRRETP